MDKTDAALQGALNAAELAAAVHAVQIVIVKGLVAARIVDAQQLRDFLAALVDDLRPDERQSAYAMCLSRVITELGKHAKLH